MRVALLDIDYKNFPNIALMKISAWHKRNGDSVEWYSPWGERYDICYVSKVFSFSKDYDLAINADKVIRGGSGYAIEMVDGREVYRKERDKDLPPEMEHTYPDYSLYPQLTFDTAYGFLTRGCPRACPFCIVEKKEGRCSRKVADLAEFWKGQKNIILCDPNLLAVKEWKDILLELAETRAWVDFNQGLDIRLMTEEKALLLGRIKMKEIHFAWDRFQERDQVLPKLRLFAEVNGLRSHKAIVYTLVNYDTSLEEDLERIYTLRDMGYWPYVMVYDKEHADRIYHDLQRWVNMRSTFASVKNFQEYKRYGAIC